ncbi:hypothetical protein EGM87_22835 [Sphingobium sp. RSMS]|uniref:hypothetical protein n=1 Tax=Sphingobium sp. RSMS TaxID=520734 RepID=UPI0010F5501F|nr:hypothetical protein [Sphingobium sp. RSMS]UXC93135.1 hypothetical protein EGM87_22835 [Sphingobium sp. RSMS]
MTKGLNRRGIVAGIALAAISVSASAQEISFAEKRAKWESCVKTAAVSLIVPAESAETIAEGGFGSCPAEQEDVRKSIARVAVAAGGETALPKITALMAEERADIKARAIAAVLAKKRGR